MEMDTVMEQSRMGQMLVVTQEYVGTEITLPADLEMNVFRRRFAKEENLNVKIGLIWSFATSTTRVFCMQCYWDRSW